MTKSTLRLHLDQRLKMLLVCLCDNLRHHLALPEEVIKLRVKQHQQHSPRRVATLAFITNKAQVTETNSPQVSTLHGWIKAVVPNFFGTRNRCSYEDLMPDHLEWS